MSSDFGSKINLEEKMYNESTYFKFELYTIHVGSINSFGGSKVAIYSQRFFLKCVFMISKPRPKRCKNFAETFQAMIQKIFLKSFLITFRKYFFAFSVL